MDYEKKYKEALQKIRELIEKGKEKGWTIITYKKDFEEIFPELKESEDEKIRQFLIHEVTETSDKVMSYRNMNKKDVLAWLEKQGEQKSFDYENANIQQKDFASKPKFKVGDWVIQENIGVYKVIEVCESWYEVIDTEDNHYSIGFDKEYMCHLWSIKDAKEGDVLYSPCLGLLWIFKSRDTVYCGYNPNYNNGSFCGEGYFERPTDAIPATKEQRDILFKKMHEAGYMWDSESKQLLSLKAEPSGEQKSAWSEEDEKELNSCIEAIEACYKWDTMVNWLKSLKERCTWKPSDKQIHAFEQVYDWYNDNFAPSETLTSLYNDLKKLKGE